MRYAFTILIIFFAAGRIIAQESKITHNTIDILPGKTVVLELDGNIVVKKSLENKAEIISILEHDGKVIGWSNKQKRMETFEIVSNRNDSHVVIKLKEREKFKVQGLSFFNEEKINHLIYIPGKSDVRIITGKGDVEIVSAEFKKLDIKNEYGNIELPLSKNMVNTARISTFKGRIIIGGKQIRDKSYVFTGKGNKNINVTAENGDIRLNIVQ